MFSNKWCQCANNEIDFFICYGLGYTTNTGTVTSVGAGTGLSISGTASINPTVNIDTAYKLPTATEWANLVDLSSAQTISGRKTFGTAPDISSIYNSTKNSSIVQFTYGANAGSAILSYGHLIAYGDDDSNNSFRPTDKTGIDDADAYYFNNGITITDANGEDDDVKLSFPPDSGTLATMEKMQGIFYCDSFANTAAKTAHCDSFTSLTSDNTKWYIMRVSNNNTTTSTLTLNVNNTGAKTLYINDNYQPGVAFTSGTYIGCYNTNWYFYSLIPTATATTLKYLLGSNSTTTTNKFETNSNCYMSAGHLYSFSRRVLEFVNSSGLTTAGPGDPRQYASDNIIKYFQLNYGAYSILIVYGLINKNTIYR